MYLFCQKDKTKSLLYKLFFQSSCIFSHLVTLIHISLIDSTVSFTAGLSKLVSNLGLHIASGQVPFVGGDGD